MHTLQDRVSQLMHQCQWPVLLPLLLHFVMHTLAITCMLRGRLMQIECGA